MTARLRNLLGVLGALLIVAGVIVYGLHAAGVWNQPPRKISHQRVEGIPNPAGGGTIQVEFVRQHELEKNSMSARQLWSIALPLFGIGIVLLMIYGFTAPAKPLPRHHQATLEFKDPFAS